MQPNYPDDIMVDLETLGKGSNAMIAAIGAVRFNDAGLGHSFYSVVNLDMYMSEGHKIDADTVKWWMKQDDAARAMFNHPVSFPMGEVLSQFYDWVGDNSRNVRIWGNGAPFDNVILRNAFESEAIVVPWEFWNDRCYRTVKAMAPHIKLQRQGTHHNALDDARTQAEHLIRIYQELGLSFGKPRL